jgi:hypothetical protein
MALRKPAFDGGHESRRVSKSLLSFQKHFWYEPHMRLQYCLPSGVAALSGWKRALAIGAFFPCLPMLGIGMAAGVFTGLVGDSQTGNGTAAFFHGNGYLSLPPKAAGSFTGSLLLEEKTLAVKGMFDAVGSETTRPVKLDGGRRLLGDPLKFTLNT